MFSVPDNFLFNIALDCLQGYHFLEPFAIYLKKYFHANSKLGSRDRRNIRQLCYAWWRIGNALKELPNNERLAIALFLSYDKKDAFSERFLKDEKLLSSIQQHPKIKCALLQREYNLLLNIADVFPLISLVERDLIVDDFVYDGFLRRNLWLRINKNFEKQVISFFENNNVSFKIHSDSKLSLQLPDDYDVVNSMPYQKGWVEIQDLSSQLLGSNYTAEPNQKWLDACAASGGKSLQLLDLHPNIDLTVTDIRESILKNLQLRFKRNHITQFKFNVVDWSLSYSNNTTTQYDAIIADVPCSGSGTWARSPEQKLSITKEKMDEFSNLQYQIMSNLLAELKPGGTIYYSTCSVYSLENSAIVNRLLDNFSLKLIEQKLIIGIGCNADTMYYAKMIKN